jgi:multidrug efflux system outer membrane protein
MFSRIKKHHRLPALRSIALIATCFVLLTGCAAKRDHYNVPVVPLPERYPKAPTVTDVTNSVQDITAAAASSCKLCVPSTPASSFALSGVLPEWWRLLGSPELDGLIDRALAHNPDLRIATLRLAQSKARLFQAGADKVPVITMPAQAKIEAPYNGIGTVGPGGQIQSRKTYQVSLRGDWRLDIWGERSAMYESAEFQLWQATFQRDDAQRILVSNVTVGYAEYLSLNDRLRVAHETDKTLTEMLAAVVSRLEVGDATVTEMEQEKTAVYSVRATIPVLEQQREVVLNRLTSLSGAIPGTLKLSDNGLDALNFPSVLPGVPSALLLRRPDVRVVEARLLAADANIDLARARVLPPLDLTAQVGYGSHYMSQLFEPHALFWNAIANLSATLFDSGKRSREVDFSQAVHEEMVETYIRVIYDAVREVDDSLSAIRLTGNRLEAQRTATESAHRAWNYSTESYMAGAVDHLVVLDTERTYHQNLDNWYNVRMERYRGLVNLFSALGGGVSMGVALPGEGARPSTLTAEIDYGAVLSATIPKQIPPAGTGEESQIAGAEVTAKTPESPLMNQKQDEVQHLSDHIDVMLTATPPSRAQIEGVDWSGNQLLEGREQWLVEMSGVYDHAAVISAWRDLRTRFPKQMENLALLPRSQGQVDDTGEERASWYRLFVAKLPDRQMADALCATLRAGLQRCEVVSSLDLGASGDFSASSPLQEMVADKSFGDIGAKGQQR